MAGRIPQTFIDDLISRVDIFDVIDTRVPLKKAGREYQACCPFHDEKTPSFTVSPNKQFYHCFGCGAHGTAIGFLMDYEHMEFVEAIEELAHSIGLDVPREEGGSETSGPKKSETAPLYELLQQAAQFYQQQLRGHSDAASAVDYLKQRGLSGEIARDFSIGYAPAGWDNLINAVGAHRRQQMLQAGLVIEKEGGGCYDRFRERIIFPIRDRRGRVIGFGGRVLGDGTPKYLNSPESSVFHKGRELYGLYEARQALRELPRLMVVEGYMDVVALAQFGLRYSVATLGTAVTTDHLELLFRTVDEVIFCFDGDRAGREAAWRGLENSLPQMRDGRQIRFLFLPDGEDPDSLIRRIGLTAFEQLIDAAMPLSDYLFEQLATQTDLSRIDGVARLVALARPYVEQLPNGIYRRLLTERLAQWARIPHTELRQLLTTAKSPRPTMASPSPAARPAPRGKGVDRQSPSMIRYAIQLLLHQPALAEELSDPQMLHGLQIPGVALLIELVEFLQGKPHLTTAALLEHWRGQDEGRHLVRLALQGFPLDEETADLKAEFNQTIARLAGQRGQHRREALLQTPFNELSDEEKRELRELVRQNDR